jgi:hypothetical protein
MRRNKHPLLLMLTALCLANNALAQQINIGRFSQGDLTGWKEKSFIGHTAYTLVNNDNRTVLQAVTCSAASGLIREIDIDLNKTPYLNWSWKIDNIYQGNNERSKKGDDYPARIYVVVSGNLFFWRTKAINYVWSSNQPVGSTWDNAYTDNAKMIAVRSGNAERGRWVSEKRNIREDLKRLFGKEIDEINAIAIMSDSDNTGQQAIANYGDIFFSDK